MKRAVASLALIALGAMGSVSPARAGQQVISTTFPMPVRAQLNLDVSDCGTAAGPSVSIQGGMALAGLGADVIFRSDEKGTADESPAASLVLFPAGQAIVVSRQQVQGGAGGRSFIWLEMVDSAGRPVTGPIAAGRCAPGVTTITADFFLPVTVSAAFQAQSCDSTPGPNVTMSGGVTLAGLFARLLFTDGDPPAAGPHPGDPPTGAKVAIVAPGRMIAIHEQSIMGGVGGNPWIGALLRLIPGDAVSDMFLLGRCAQVSR